MPGLFPSSIDPELDTYPLEWLPSMSDMLDHALPFVVRKIEAYKKNNTLKPFFVGLNGVQGAGKTTLVSLLQARGVLAASSPSKVLPLS